MVLCIEECLRHIMTAFRLGEVDRLFYGIPLQRAETRHLAAAW